ncbi:MAG TPA: TonB-dependent receptor [Phenylobacterium sp.]|uniref:TonB-dependent receptor n=1 Tax=Phenylobacterium sp. TaxID=1871053 RepID=UPI002BC56439|nr:TonB-dependent receptor [Phenylobacterium sp.]HXA38403.1 TonB-dependent receptor [Phenylobacterium sp.]
MSANCSRRTALVTSSAVAAALLAGACATPVFAADAAPSATALSEIIVTAQKRAENINDVPESLTAIGGEKLDVIRSSGGDIRVLSARVPSLLLESSFGRTFPRPYIRGLGNTDFDLNASQPVSFVYDDVVLENPILKGVPLFDIDQVEVLRGPQGTLFGRNTPAGVLKFDSVKPSQTFGGYGQASVATYGTVNLEGAVGGPIIADTLSGRFSALYQHRDPWIDNTFTHEKNATGGYDEYALRGQLLFTPTPEFNALANLHYFHLDGTPQIFRANIITPGTNDLVPGFDPEKIAQDAQKRSFQKVKEAGGSLKMNYDFGGPVLTSITAYEHVTTLSHGDIDGGFGAAFAPPSGPGFIPFPSESADGLPYHAQWSEEVRLAGKRDALSYTVGAFYFFEDVKIDSFDYNTLAGGALDGFAIQHQKTTSWALFGNADYKLTPRWTVGGGLRYSNDQKDFLAQRFISPIGGGATPVLRANPTSDDVSFNVNTTFALDDNTNLYARAAKGYRAPSIQGRLLFGDTISVARKETLMSYEGGFKSNLFDHRARIDADVFYYKVDNLQLTAVGGGANFNRLINAAHAEGYGFEFDGEAEPIERLIFTAGLSYNHTRIDDPNLTTQPCGDGCTVLDPAGAIPGTVNINGNNLPNAPRWIGNVTATYSIPYGDGEFFAFTDWAYRSSVSFFLYQSKEFTGQYMLEGGVRLGYRAAGDKWEAAFFGRNITNRIQLEGGIDFNNLTGFVNDPRTFGVEVKTKF